MGKLIKIKLNNGIPINIFVLFRIIQLSPDKSLSIVHIKNVLVKKLLNQPACIKNA